jgi:hypothetical protein
MCKESQCNNPATREEEVEGSRSNAGPGKSEKLYLKNQLKQRRLGMGLNWQPQYCQN